MNDVKKEIIIEERWLTYFNDTARQQGLISERDWVRIKNKISERTNRKMKKAMMEENR